MKHEDIAILEAMDRFGGSFTKAIALAAWRADSENYAKLRTAFADLWKTYKSYGDYKPSEPFTIDPPTMVCGRELGLR